MNRQALAHQLLSAQSAIAGALELLRADMEDEQQEPYVAQLREPAPACKHKHTENMTTFGSGPRSRCTDCGLILEGV
jgi:hypothetical protein